MVSKKLETARNYEVENINTVPGYERPVFHVTGGIGWINDPNGFGEYNGEYHLFFQYHPYSTEWGPMHWGHVKSKDFVKWDRLPIALAPDQEYDNFGCFSGSSLELPDCRHLLIYTSVHQVKNEATETTEEFQQQAIAVGNGIDYEKSKLNPVITTEMIPEGNSRFDFRDPKIWFEGDCYYVVVGSRASDGGGEILLYKSCDLENFEYLGVVDASKNQYGKMWECPDYFLLDGRRVLCVSPQEMEGLEPEFINGNNTMFILGETDSLCDFVRDNIHTVDYGIDFYAPQTFLNSDGRRILIGWMQNWDTSKYLKDEKKIYGSMTLPREIFIKDNRVYQKPVREIENYYVSRVEEKSLIVSDKESICNVAGRVFDMTISIRDYNECRYNVFNIYLAEDDTHYTKVEYNKSVSTITIDRSNCGCDKSIVNSRTFNVIGSDDELKLRILMDVNGMELFVDDGREVASMLIYTPIDATNISFECDNEAEMDILFQKIQVD